MASNNYKIGEIASLLATSIRTIRFYEEEGLLKPIRTARGTRLYSDKHIARLKTILRLTKLGFSIEAIRKIAEIREQSKTGDEGSILLEHHFAGILNIIANQMIELQKISLEINSAQTIISGCHGCSNTPSSQGCPNCPVKERVNDIELLNLVWDTEN